MFQYKSPITGLEVVEYLNGYELSLGDKDAWMSDGVDMFEGISPGTDEFDECMKELIDDPETVEAYFPEEKVNATN